MAFQDADAVNISGSVSLYGNAVNPLDAVPKQQLDSSLNSAIGAEKFGRLIGIQDFEIVGTSTYTPSVGTKTILVQMVGGGAGSSGTVATNASQYTFAEHGQHGGYCSFYMAISSGTYLVTVGAQGVGGNVGVIGTSGGNSTLSKDSVIVATASGGQAFTSPGAKANGVASFILSFGSNFSSVVPSSVIRIISSGPGAASKVELIVTNMPPSGISVPLTHPVAVDFIPAGQGGSCRLVGSSSSAFTGHAGQPGKVRIYEYG
jgi:hypothetical protein